MFKTVRRIIDWCGKFKGRLYAGFAFSFFSHIFAAMPLMVAAYTIGLLIDSQKTGAAFDTSWIWKCIVIQVVLWLGLDTNLLKLLQALIVAVFLAIPYWKNSVHVKKEKGGARNA